MKPNETIEAEAQKAINEIEALVSSKNKKERESVQKRNESPCTVCGKSEFVMKYRDVNGKIEGKMSGSFSLFGGSISGYVDGSIQTAPVLSCRNCENERKIEIPDITSGSDIVRVNLPHMYDYVDSTPCSKWLQEKGLEVAAALDREYYIREITDYDDKLKYSDKRLASVGLVRKYSEPEKEEKGLSIPTLCAIVAIIIGILLIIYN